MSLPYMFYSAADLAEVIVQVVEDAGDCPREELVEKIKELLVEECR